MNAADLAGGGLIAQTLAGLVLALALADLLPRPFSVLRVLAVARGLLTSLALASEDHFLAAALIAVTAGGLLPWLVWRDHPVMVPRLTWPVWAAAVAVTPLALAAGALGLPLAILMTGLLTVLARPSLSAQALALTTMQLGIALVPPLFGGAGWPATLVAYLPLAAGLVLLTRRQPA